MRLLDNFQLRNVLILFSLLSVISLCDAANLTVRVFKQAADGQGTAGALGGAKVCYEPQTGPSKSGIADAEGRVTFTAVPEGNLTVKANKEGFKGKAVSFFMQPKDSFQQINLVEGVGTLACADGTVTGVSDPPFVGPIKIVTFTLDNGAATTTSRAVQLNFTTGPRDAGQQNPKPEFYRVAEPEGGLSLLATLEQKPFLTLVTGTTFVIPHKLLLRRSQDQARYGGRTVALQVKSGTHTSIVVPDTIQLDPVLREYTAPGSVVFPFAEAHGFKRQLDKRTIDSQPGSPKCFECPPSQIRRTTDHTCTLVETSVFFSGQTIKPFWRILRVIGGTTSNPGLNLFRHVISRSLGPVPNQPEICIDSLFPDPDLVLQGPTEDDFIDPANPWKNAFAQQ
jgi:hypothetical protein